MDGRKCATVPRVHRLQQVIAALIAYLAHDDAVGAVTKSGGQKLAWRDGDLAGNGIDGFPANGVGMSYLQLGRLFNHNQPLSERNVIEQSFHEGGLAGTRSTTDNAVLPLANQAHNGISNALRQATRCDQFIRS